MNPQTGPAEIHEGQLAGKSIEFFVVRTANGTTNRIWWRGTIDGEVIHFTRSVEGAPGPGMAIVAQRAAEAADTGR